MECKPGALIITDRTESCRFGRVCRTSLDRTSTPADCGLAKRHVLEVTCRLFKALWESRFPEPAAEPVWRDEASGVPSPPRFPLQQRQPAAWGAAA